jgi:cytochrome P450
MGSRTCVGKNISLMEMAKIIPQIVRKFDVELAFPKKEWGKCFLEIEMMLMGLVTTNHWFVKQKNMLVNVSRRK